MPYITNTVGSILLAGSLAACSREAGPNPAPVAAPTPSQQLVDATVLDANIMPEAARTPVPDPMATSTPTPEELLYSDLERKFFSALNQDRTADGLSPLKLDPTLSQLAEVRSLQLLNAGRISHFDNNGNLVLRLILSQNSISFATAGENLAQNNFSLDDTVKVANIGLMNSPAHRANILNPNYDKVGVGVRGPNNNGEIVYAQLFLQTP